MFFPERKGERERKKRMHIVATNKKKKKGGKIIISLVVICHRQSGYMYMKEKKKLTGSKMETEKHMPVNTMRKNFFCG